MFILLKTRSIFRINFSYPILFISDATKNYESSICAKSLEEFRNSIKDAESERQIKIILMEYNMMKEMGLTVPSKLKKRDMEILLRMELPSDRRTYITRNLFVREENNQATFIMQKEKLLERNKHFLNGHIPYGTDQNCLHGLLRVHTELSFYVHNLAQAAKFGQPLIIDVDFDEQMNENERIITANQIRSSYGVNRYHCNPFDLHLCNISKKSLQTSTQQHLERIINNFYHPRYMMTVSEKSYLDIFPDKKKLVYLSANATETMRTYDHDAIYIIGGLVDLVKQTSHSFEKAKEEGIQIQKLPLEKYLIFKPGFRRNLSLNHVTRVLLNMKISGDWTHALDNLPNSIVTNKLKEELLIEEALFDRETNFKKFFRKKIF